MEKIPYIRLLVLLVVLVYLMLSLQRKLLYYPSADLPAKSSLAGQNLQFWPEGSQVYQGLIAATPPGKVKGTIIVHHGNGGTAADRTYYIKPLTELGYRVVLAEYPGYGGRIGQPSEEVFVHDAKVTLRLASEKYGSPMIMLGESLGCGAVAAVARDMPEKIDGLILITPWDSLYSIAKEVFPWLPVRLLLRDEYDSMQNLKGFGKRIAIAGAERDEVIPMRHAQALYQSLTGERKMFVIKGAGHNDWSLMVDGMFWKELVGYVEGKD